VENITIKAGKNKDLASPFRQMTDAERRLLQEVMDDIHDQFIEAVASGRGRTIDEVTPMADGRIFSGRQAMKQGLVDELGTLDEAIDKAGELAGIEGRPRVVEFRPSPLQELLGGAKQIFPWLPSAMNGTPVWTQVRALYMMSL
jgi:protease-4